MFAIELRRKSAHSIEFGSGYVQPSTRAKGRDLRTEGGNPQREVDAFHRRRIDERYQGAGPRHSIIVQRDIGGATVACNPKRRRNRPAVNGEFAI
jgi:hypothetical protein